MELQQVLKIIGTRHSGSFQSTYGILSSSLLESPERSLSPFIAVQTFTGSIS
jgi:hypothetical protein